MNITIVDDGRGKPHSVAANTEHTVSYLMYDGDITLTSFGQTSTEAKSNIILVAEEFKRQLEAMIADLKSEASP